MDSEQYRSLEAIRRDPAPGSEITVAAKVEQEEAVSDLSDVGEIEKELPYGVYRVRVTEQAVDELCSLSGISSINVDREFDIASGN